VTSSHATHPGLVRQNNEDYIRADDSLGIYLLADGMGGHNAGEVASALAVDMVYAAISANIPHTAIDGIFDLMVDAMRAAHWEISTKARTSLSFMGMGTTLVVAVVRENTAYIAHAGDSRVYHYSAQPHPPPNPSTSLRTGLPLESGGTSLQRLTNDHTMGDQLLANGVPREQIQEKQFHTLTQAVGCGEPPIPDFNTVELNQGDLLLLCSDGLTDMLADNEIEAILAHGDGNLNQLAENLIDAANAKGGLDNISVVLVHRDI
jgi:protein phosphatase